MRACTRALENRRKERKLKTNSSRAQRIPHTPDEFPAPCMHTHTFPPSLQHPDPFHWSANGHRIDDSAECDCPDEDEEDVGAVIVASGSGFVMFMSSAVSIRGGTVTGTGEDALLSTTEAMRKLISPRETIAALNIEAG